MAQAFNAPIPPNLDLDANYTIEFTALDATTGAAVTSVVVSNATIQVANLTGGSLSVPPTEDQPLWIDLPNDFEESEGG